MSGNDIDRTLADWFESDALAQAPADGVERALAGARRRSPRPGWFAGPGSHWVGGSVGSSSGAGTLGRTGLRTSMALLLLLLVLALVAGAVLVGARLLQPAPADLGIFKPISGWVVYGNNAGIWGDNPDGADFKLTVMAGTPLGWSSDGTRLLIERDELLFVLHSDATETQLPTHTNVHGATISPDGSRVVFAGEDALYAVDADGGPAQTLLEVEGLEGVSFSPDGSQVAYVMGRGDGDHRVWLIAADGTNAREILANDVTLGPGHDHGLAWSPAGDRIALGIEGAFYTFAPDGSSFSVARHLAGQVQPFWSPDGSQLETRGPRHPGVPATDETPPSPLTTAPSQETAEPAGQLVLYLDSWRDGDRTEMAVYADGRVIRGPDERGGYLEQRLTPEGLERLRSRALSTGLFERDLLATAIDDLVAGTGVVGFGYIKVLRGDRPVIVAWGTTPEVDVSGHGLEDRWVHASSAQAAEVTELDDFLRDPTTWGLTDDMYLHRELTPFIPSHLWVSYDRGRPDWSQLPSPAREVVTRIMGPGFMDGCSNISLDQAREIARVLTQAGFIAEYDDRLGLSFSLPSPPSFVHAHPALPHDIGTVCGEG